LPQYKTSQTTDRQTDRQTDDRRQTTHCTIGSTDSTVGQKADLFHLIEFRLIYCIYLFFWLPVR